MPLKPQEVMNLTPRLTKLIAACDRALERDDDGKVRITRDEAKELRNLALDLAWRLTRDCLD